MTESAASRIARLAQITGDLNESTATWSRVWTNRRTVKILNVLVRESRAENKNELLREGAERTLLSFYESYRRFLGDEEDLESEGSEADSEDSFVTDDEDSEEEEEESEDEEEEGPSSKK